AERFAPSQRAFERTEITLTVFGPQRVAGHVLAVPIHEVPQNPASLRCVPLAIHGLETPDTAASTPGVITATTPVLHLQSLPPHLDPAIPTADAVESLRVGGHAAIHDLEVALPALLQERHDVRAP